MVLVRRNLIQTLVLGRSPALLTKSVEFNLERTFSKRLFNLKKESGRAVFFNKYFLVYGYVTNEIKVFNRANGTLEFNQEVDSRVECVQVNQEHSLILVGCQSGLLQVYELDYEPQRLVMAQVQCLSFPSPVVHISEHDGFFAISFGCYVGVYRIERTLGFLSRDPQRCFVRFFRSFCNPLPVKGAFLADSPLYSLLLYDNAHLKVYSINGQLIRTCSWAVKGVQRMTDAELSSVFCIHEEGRLMLVSTPDLRCLSEL